MRHLTATLCLTIAVLLGSAGMSWSADFQKGLTAHDNGDYATALREWKPLAEQSGASTQYNLRVIYQREPRVLRFGETALKLFTLAAEQGYADAQSNLGLMYYEGTGVIQDTVYAHMWFNIAVSNGNETGGKLRDFVAKQMTSSQLETAQRLARECVRKKYKGC